MIGINKETVTHSLTTMLAMTTPAVRMVVISVWHDDEAEPQEGHTFDPVIAIVAKVNQVYYRDLEPNNPLQFKVAPTDQAMIEGGWKYDWVDSGYVDYDVLIHTDEYGLIEASSVFDGEWECYETEVCPWPPEEDEERLSEVVASLKDRLRQDRESRQKASTA